MAKEEKNAEETPEEGEEKGGKSKKKLILLLLLLVVMGAAAAVWFFFLKENVPPDDPDKALTEKLANEAGGGEGNTHAPKPDPHAPEPDAHAPKPGAHGGGDPGEEGKVDESNVVELKAITVNLRGQTSTVVRIQFYVAATDKEAKELIEKARYPIRDALNSLVSSKSWDVLNSEEGMILLRRDIIRKIEQKVGPGKVDSVGVIEGPIKLR